MSKGNSQIEVRHRWRFVSQGNFVRSKNGNVCQMPVRQRTIPSSSWLAGLGNSGHWNFLVLIF